MGIISGGAGTILDAASFFSKTLIPTVGGNVNRRVPFTFSSTSRLMDSGLPSSICDRAAAKVDSTNILSENLRILDGRSNEDGESDVPTTVRLLDSASSALGSLGLSQYMNIARLPVISMMVNPNSVKWSQAKRYTKRDTKRGSVFFHFSDENGSNNDILTLAFSGNTGNIQTQGPVSYDAFGETGAAAVTSTGADLKLKTWHELYNLTREPVLLPTGIKNEFFISYRTVLMPMPITFIGFFNSVLDFTESAQNPFSRDYSFSFTVTNTSPSLDILVDKLNSSLALLGPISAYGSMR